MIKLSGPTRAVAKSFAQVGRADACRPRVSQCPRVSVPAGGAPAVEGAPPHLPDVVLILGDIGEMRKIAEGAHDAHGLAGRHAVEDDFELAPRRLVVVAVEPDRGLPDAFDQVEHIGALLVAHGVAEDTSQERDVVSHSQGVFLECASGIFAAIGPQFGVRKA